MIKTTILAMFAVSILLTGTIAGPMLLFQPAEAVKSQGTPLPTVGSKKVCGDRLCSEIPEEKPKEEKKKEQVKQEKNLKNLKKQRTIH